MSLEKIREERLKKLQILKECGFEPYPAESKRTIEIKEVRKRFSDFELSKEEETVAGRVMALRPQGGIIFAELDDGTGRVQIMLREKDTEEKLINLFSETVDIGDFAEASGSFFKTKRGEETLLVKSWRMLGKSVLPIPDKWYGLEDVEERFRKRYLDLISSEEVRKRFIVRSKIISEIRRFLDSNDFVEVETSILQSLPGGANAKPFKTHLQALNLDLYLRIAPEIDLKKLLIGGMPKIYEIGKNFRNEGIDLSHNPEFTAVEWYEAYSDAAKQMVFVEKLMRTLVKRVTSGSKIYYEETAINFSKKFDVISYYDLLKRYALIDRPESASLEELKLKAIQLGSAAKESATREQFLDAIYKRACRPKLIQPTFIVDYPTAMIPLAKKKEGNQNLVDAFQLVAGGLELVKAFSELNDPKDQAERFKTEEEHRKVGDEEAQMTDSAFIEALEYGMPPAGGVGIGIDRLAMLLTGERNIREVVLFPTLRPK